MLLSRYDDHLQPEGPVGECGGSGDLSDYAKKTCVDTQNNLMVAGGLAMTNCKVTGLAGPTAAHEAATKDYVDMVVSIVM